MPMTEIYLMFDGTCEAAMRFYEKTLDGKLEILLRHGDSPMAEQCAPADKDRIMHSRLLFDGGSLMATDGRPGGEGGAMKGFSIALSYDTVADATRVFNALAEGGEVRMPLQKTFWAEAFGALVDRYGTPWMINGALAKM